MHFRRISGLSGFVFASLAIANAVLLGDAPSPEDDLTTVREYIESDQTLHKAALFALVLATAFAVLFFAGVVDLLRVSDVEHSEGWGIAVLAGSIIMASAAILGDTLFAILIYRGGSGLDDSTLRLLKDGELIAYSAIGISLTSVAISAAIPTFIHHTLPTWHGAIGVVVAVLGIFGPIAMITDTNAGVWLHLIMMGGLGVWVMATSVVLLRNSWAQRDRP